MSDKSDFLEEACCQVPTNIIDIYGDHIPFDVYLKLSNGEIVKLENRGKGVKKQIELYTERCVKCVFANKMEFIVFIDE